MKSYQQLANHLPDCLSMRSRLSTLIVAVLTTVALSGVAVADDMPNQVENAQSSLETIEITGDYSRLSLEQIAQSATVLERETIIKRNAQHIESILNIAPNVNISSGASRAKFVQIRGIGERSQFAEPINPSVAIVIDGVDVSGLGSLATLLDVSQVEVLRGPQATVFGASGLAGVININSNAPTQDAQGSASLTLGQQEAFELAGAYGAGISDDVAARLAFAKVQNNGFVTNQFLGTNDTNNIDEFSGRLSVDWQLSAQAQLQVRAFHTYINNGYDAFSLDNDNVTRSDEPGKDRTQANAISVSSINQTSWGSYRINTSILQTESLYSYDEDWTFVGFHPWEYSSVDVYQRERDSTALEFIAQSQPGALSWTAGASYKTSTEDLVRQYTYNEGDFTSNYEPTALALFGYIENTLTDNVVVDAGLRVERYSLDYADNTGFVESQDDTLVGGKLGLSYLLDDTTYYASVARGYKAAGFNPDQAVNTADRVFAAEYNWNYELGAKYRLHDGDASLRVALFRMARKDTQISDFAVVQGDDNSVQFIDIIKNADNGTNQGLELEYVWQAADNVQVGTNIGLLDATFNGFTRADGTPVSKQDQAQAPSHTFHAYVDLGLTDTWSVYAEVEGKAKHRFSDGHDEINPAYQLVNLRATYDAGAYSVSVFAHNALDKEYYTRGFGGFSNDPREYYEIAKPYYQFGSGRRFGVTVNVEF